MTQSEASDSRLDHLRSVLRDLAARRGRPCLAVIGEIDRSALAVPLPALRGVEATEIDLLVRGPGGDIEAAYLVARTIRRRYGIGAASTWARSDVIRSDEPRTPPSPAALAWREARVG